MQTCRAHPLAASSRHCRGCRRQPLGPSVNRILGSWRSARCTLTEAAMLPHASLNTLRHWLSQCGFWWCFYSSSFLWIPTLQEIQFDSSHIYRQMWCAKHCVPGTWMSGIQGLIGNSLSSKARDFACHCVYEEGSHAVLNYMPDM